MKNTRLFALLTLAALAGCQSVPSPKPTATAPTNIKDDSWNGLELGLVQFVAEEKGFTCLAPSGVDFASNGAAFKKTVCFKTEQCETTSRIIYLDAHSMQVTSTEESRAPTAHCVPAEESLDSANLKPSSK